MSCKFNCLRSGAEPRPCAAAESQHGGELRMQTDHQPQQWIAALGSVLPTGNVSRHSQELKIATAKQQCTPSLPRTQW